MSGKADLPPTWGPDFLCVGSQKAGTGWLRDQLSNHSAVWIPRIGELHYFDNNFGPRSERSRARLKKEPLTGSGDMQKGREVDQQDLYFMRHAATYRENTIDFAWYAQLFAPKGKFISGDITPAYSTLQSPMVTDIRSAFPGLKIIFLIRDPVERFWSQVAMKIRHTGSSINPEDWKAIKNLLLSPEFALRSFPTQTAQIWRKAFGSERVFIGQFDDLQSRAGWLRLQILEFLNLEPEAPKQIPANFDRKAGAWKPKMTAAMRERIAEHFREELRRCGDEFGGPAERWASNYGF